MAGRSSPVRTCVGCRARALKSDLLRVVAVESGGQWTVVPDPLGRKPGRGASLHPVPACLDRAERRRVFPRALRVPGPLDTVAVRIWMQQRQQGRDGEPTHLVRMYDVTRSGGQQEAPRRQPTKAGRDRDERSMSPQR